MSRFRQLSQFASVRKNVGVPVLRIEAGLILIFQAFVESLRSPRFRLKRMLFVLVLATCAINVGCVQRRLIVRSQPEGALVTIDNHTIGHTPLKVPFVYYGTRQVQLEKEGYETVKVKERIRPPWYDKFPLSFFSNNFAFREVRDERMLDITLEPRSQVEENMLLDRANDLRLNTQRETLACPPSAPFQ